AGALSGVIASGDTPSDRSSSTNASVRRRLATIATYGTPLSSAARTAGWSSSLLIAAATTQASDVVISSSDVRRRNPSGAPRAASASATGDSPRMTSSGAGRTGSK